MNDFVRSVREGAPEAGKTRVFWLGQAGFLIKTAKGHTIGIDPYFSDCVARLFPEIGLGFKRLSPPPCRADELALDVLLISHEHADHFDVDSIAALMANGHTKVYANAPVVEQMRGMALDMSRVTTLRKGEPVALPDCTLTPMDCDHGPLAPEALGFMLDFDGVSVYYAGDTALTLDRLQPAIARRPDVAIVPINGAFGNLDGVQGATYAGLLQCKICIPCHFWTFPFHHGDPQTFLDAMPEKAPDVKPVLLCQGEFVDVG